jgi:hypothetical protein
MGLEGYKEVKTASGIVFCRQGWWRRVRFLKKCVKDAGVAASST